MIRNVAGAILLTALLTVALAAQESTKNKGTAPIEVSGMVGAEFGELDGKVREMDDGKHCGRQIYESAEAISLEELAGGKVKTIRVVRTETYQGAPALKAEAAKAKVQKVWAESFGFASCQIGWSEPTMWSVEAELKFEDGKTGLLITDGWHVAMQDHNGNRRFMR